MLAAGKTARRFTLKKNSFLGFGALAVLLALGLVLAGCPNGTTDDTWTDVTSMSQMNGTWKTSYNQTEAIKDFIGSSSWDNSMATLFGDMKVTTSVNMTIIINASAKTQAMSGTATMTFSGGNIATAWGTLKQNMGSGSGVTVDDAKHSITMPQNQPAETMSDATIAKMLADGMQINQNGTKIKVPAGTGEDDSPEMTLTKQ
jgi:hypothetical protein